MRSRLAILCTPSVPQRTLLDSGLKWLARCGNGSIATLEPLHRSHSGQLVPDLNQPLHRPAPDEFSNSGSLAKTIALVSATLGPWWVRTMCPSGDRRKRMGIDPPPVVARDIGCTIHIHRSVWKQMQAKASRTTLVVGWAMVWR
jgi:hypothetical protein